MSDQESKFNIIEFINMSEIGELKSEHPILGSSYKSFFSHILVLAKDVEISFRGKAISLKYPKYGFEKISWLSKFDHNVYFSKDGKLKKYLLFLEHEKVSNVNFNEKGYPNKSTELKIIKSFNDDELETIKSKYFFKKILKVEKDEKNSEN